MVRDGRASRTAIKGEPELEAGDLLKEDTPIVITALWAPKRDDLRNRVIDVTNIQGRLEREPVWFEGTWRGTQVETANTDLNTSTCDADTRTDMMPEVVISDANGAALTVHADVKALLHYHDKRQAAHVQLG